MEFQVPGDCEVSNGAKPDQAQNVQDSRQGSIPHFFQHPSPVARAAHPCCCGPWPQGATTQMGQMLASNFVLPRASEETRPTNIASGIRPHFPRPMRSVPVDPGRWAPGTGPSKAPTRMSEAGLWVGETEMLADMAAMQPTAGTCKLAVQDIKVQSPGRAGRGDSFPPPGWAIS